MDKPDKPQILIVEDDLDLSDMIASYFRVQNYEVVTAAWGEEALKLADETHLDLIMLDIRLPDIDGFELCRRLRSQRKTKDLPILFLTEKRDRVDKLTGLELGVVDYITKPFDIQELRLRVRNAINRAQQANTVNPVTELPEGDLVDERLNALLTSGRPWAVLQLGLEDVAAFRERYGFVAADDVLRAVSLMVRNTVKEQSLHEAEDESDFIGHIEEDFLIITKPDKVEIIRERVQSRLRQSREYFYPLKDRVRQDNADLMNYLTLRSSKLTHRDGPLDHADALKEALQRRMRPENQA